MDQCAKIYFCARLLCVELDEKFCQEAGYF